MSIPSHRRVFPRLALRARRWCGCIAAGVGLACAPMAAAQQQGGSDPIPEQPDHWDCWEESKEGLAACTRFCPKQFGNPVADSNLEVSREQISTTGMAGCLNDLTTEPPADCTAVFLDMLGRCAAGTPEEQVITCTRDYDTDPGALDACQNLATTFFEWCEGEVPSAAWTEGTIEKLAGLRPGSRQELWIESANPAIDRFELRLYRLGPVSDRASREITLGTTSIVGRFVGVAAHAADVSLEGQSLRPGEAVYIVAEAYAGESARGVLTFRTEIGFEPDDLNRDGRTDAEDLFEAVHDPDIKPAQLDRIIRRVLLLDGR